MLLESVWEYHFDPQTNVIDVHISRLRAKIDKGFDAPLLHTVRGAGYMIRARATVRHDPCAGLLLRTQAFRIVLVYVLLFAVSVTALLRFTYWNTARTLDAQTDQIIEAEITGLSEQYQQLGLRGPGGTRASAARCMAGQALYLLADGAHQPIAGNLDAWPANRRPMPGSFVEFDYERPYRWQARNAPRARPRLRARRRISSCSSRRTCMSAI